MVLTKAKYYIRPILWVIGYVLLCVAGGFFIYLILVANPPGRTQFPFGRLAVWTIGLTLSAIGLVGLLLIFKLLDYSRKTEDYPVQKEEIEECST